MTQADKEKMDALLEAYFENKSLKSIERYVASGRPYEKTDEATLSQQWRNGWLQYARTLDPSAYTTADDCAAEYTLRNVPLPNDPEVKSVIAELEQRALAMTQEMMMDPARRSEFVRGLLRDIATDLDEMKAKPEN